MSQEMIAVIVFGTMGAVVMVMFIRERRAVARRKAARGGREVDLSNVFDPTRKNGAPAKD